MKRFRYAKKKTTGVKKALNRMLGKKSQYRKAAKVNVRKDLHYFKRNLSLPSITGDGVTVNRFGVWTFKLNDLPNYTEFTSLFDRYMITHVKMRIRLQNDPSTQSAGYSNYPQLFYVKDYDDNVALSSMDQIREHGKMKSCILKPYKDSVINLKPSILANYLESSSGGVMVAPKWKQWCDLASVAVPHYGIKYAIDNLFNSNYTVLVRCTYYFRCKDTR